MRSVRSIGSVAGNNFFLFVLLLAQQPSSAVFLFLLIGLLILFPLSADPLRAIPRERFALWPFSHREALALRVGTLLLSPLAWLVAAAALLTRRWALALQIAVAGVVIQALIQGTARLRARFPAVSPMWWVPALPGVIGALMRKDLRQFLCSLDLWLSALVAGLTVAYRWLSSKPDMDAIPVMTLMAVLCLSTWTQCLFGYDGEAGRLRYRLFPIRGWRILLAKDLVWIAVCAFLVTPLAPAAGMAAGFAALAVGHHGSVLRTVSQRRWRFTSGHLLPVGLLQAIAIFSTGMAAQRMGIAWLGGSVAAWALSLFAYGFVWDYWRPAR
jgi:hypothetical protein